MVLYISEEWDSQSPTTYFTHQLLNLNPHIACYCCPCFHFMSVSQEAAPYQGGDKHKAHSCTKYLWMNASRSSVTLHVSKTDIYILLHVWHNKWNVGFVDLSGVSSPALFPYWHEDKCGSAAKIETCICTEVETMKLRKAHQNEEWQLHYEDISRASREMSLSEYFLLASSTLCFNARHFHFTSQPQALECGDVS